MQKPSTTQENCDVSPQSAHQADTRRLLIVGCSARKLPTTKPIAALNLYDGVAFRVLRKAEREGRFPSDVDVLILSARYGLISSQEQISTYDERFTPRRAREEASSNTENLRVMLNTDCYREVFLCLGATYRLALQPYDTWLSSHTKLRLSEGGIGCQLQQLKDWLSS